MGAMKTGSSLSDARSWPRLIESLARICKQYPIDRKILAVQSHHAGQLILQSLAKCSGGWLNLRAVTPAELAWDAIAAEASARGLMAADDVTLEGTVIEAYQGTKRAFFPERPPLGLLSAIQRTILELRNAEVTPAKLRSSRVITPEKASDLAAILEQYTAALRRDSLLDEAGIYSLAIGKSSARTTLLVPAGFKALGLCRKLLSCYGAGRVLTVAEDPARSHRQQNR